MLTSDPRIVTADVAMMEELMRGYCPTTPSDFEASPQYYVNLLAAHALGPKDLSGPSH